MTIWQVKYFIEDLNEHILSPLFGAFNHCIQIWIFIFYFYFLLFDFYFSFLSFIPFIVSQTVKCNYNDNVLSLLNWIIINLNKFNAHQIQNSNSNSHTYQFDWLNSLHLNEMRLKINNIEIGNEMKWKCIHSNVFIQNELFTGNISLDLLILCCYCCCYYLLIQLQVGTSITTTSKWLKNLT